MEKLPLSDGDQIKDATNGLRMNGAKDALASLDSQRRNSRTAILSALCALLWSAGHSGEVRAETPASSGAVVELLPEAPEVTAALAQIEAQKPQGWRGFFDEQMARYTYNPQSAEEVHYLAENLWWLNREDVLAAYQILQGFGYEFDPKFIEESMDAVGWHEFVESFNTQLGLIINLAVLEGLDSPYITEDGTLDETAVTDYYHTEANAFITTSFDKILKVFARPGPLTQRLAAFYQGHYANSPRIGDLVFVKEHRTALKPQTGEQDSAYQKRWRQGPRHAADLNAQFPEEARNAFSLACIANPRMTAQLERWMRYFPLPSSETDSESFHAFVVNGPLLDDPTMQEALSALALGVVGPLNLGDYHSLAKITSAYARIPLSFDEAAVARIAKYGRVLERPSPLSIEDFETLARIDIDFLNEDLDDVARGYMLEALKARDSIEKGQALDDLEIFFAWYGVNPAYIHIFYRLTVEAGIAFQNLEIIMPILLKGFAEKPDLLDPTVRLLVTAQFEEDDSSNQDVALSNVLRLDPESELFQEGALNWFRFLHETYNYPYTLLDATLFQLQWDREPEIMRSYKAWLETEELSTFYAENKAIFAPNDPEKAISLNDLLLIPELYILIQDGEVTLQDVVLYHSIGGELTLLSEVLAVEGYLSLLKDPRMVRLRTVSETLFPVPEEKRELTYSKDELSNLIQAVDRLEEPEFLSFCHMLHDRYGVVLYPFHFANYAQLYLDSKLRRLLEDPATQDFAATMDPYGIELNMSHVEDFFQAVDRYKTVAADIHTIEAVYDINVAKQLNPYQGKLETISRMTENLFWNDDKGKFNLASRLKALRETGRFDLLINPMSAAHYGFFHDIRFGYTLDIHDVDAWLQLLEHPNRLEQLESESFDYSFWARLRREVAPDHRFHPNDATLYLDLYMLGDIFFDTVNHLKAEPYNYAFGRSSPENSLRAILRPPLPASLPKREGSRELKNGSVFKDLMLMNELIKNPYALAALWSTPMQELIRSLTERGNYHFALADTWALLDLLEHPDKVEHIFDPAVDEFSKALFDEDIQGQAALQYRLILLEVVRDETMRNRLLSPEAQRILDTLHEDNAWSVLVRGDVNLNQLKALALLVEYPEAVPLIQKYRREIPYAWDFRGGMVHPLDFVHSFVQLSKSPQGLDALDWAFTQKYYNFYPNDGIVWVALIQEGYTLDTLQIELGRFERQCKGLWAARHLYQWLHDPKFVADRASLEARLKPRFNGEVHRSDGNFQSWESYNDLSKWDIFGLNTLRLGGEALGQDVRLRNSIGALIAEDIEHRPYSEMGFLLRFQPGSDYLQAVPYISEVNYSNGAYRTPDEMVMNAPISLALAHLHATQWEDGSAAGPSGLFDAHGGDIDYGLWLQQMGMVVTSLSLGQFAVHIYDPNRNVAFVGTYKYELPPK